jgi:hypothetical protein
MMAPSCASLRKDGENPKWAPDRDRSVRTMLDQSGMTPDGDESTGIFARGDVVTLSSSVLGSQRQAIL